MANTKHSFVIEQIKLRLQEGFYKIDATTFINVSQQIYKYASKGKNEYKSTIQGSADNKVVRNTLNMKDPEQHLVMNFFEMMKNGELEQHDTEENEEEFMTVYLTESSSKEFNRYILEVLTQIRNFYKLEVFADANFDEGGTDPEKQQIIFENKMDEIKLEDYIKHIRAGCLKNDAN